MRWTSSNTTLWDYEREGIRVRKGNESNAAEAIHVRNNESQWVFPGGPVVRALCFHCRGHGFDPWSGNQDSTSHMARPKKKKKNQKERIKRNNKSQDESGETERERNRRIPETGSKTNRSE